MFAQLHSLGKRNNKDLDSRIKECPDIIEPATVVIEMIPNFQTKTTSFCIVKDRFGLQGTRIECDYNNGRFTPMVGDIQDKINELNRAKAEEELTKLQGKMKNDNQDL
jgi:hypothetical protein